MSAFTLFQDGVYQWVKACFGETTARSKKERNFRFLEEALELVQSTGCTKDEAHMLVDYVFGRPVGDTSQEVGGVMVTLAALCSANDVRMEECGYKELARIWSQSAIDRVRSKFNNQEPNSPLPGKED